MGAKKTRQKTVEGGAPPTDTPQGVDGLLLAFEVRDVIRHDKNGTASIPLFANLGPKGEARLGTVVVNINGLTAEGMAYLERTIGTKLVAKTDKRPGTPLLGTLVVAEGSLLDHWNHEHPTKEDIKKADAEAKKQAKLDTGTDA
jgi:hypothetical protein